ncbi:GGDEF domain-containing protein [Deinococcus peraridilitoris]|uniref:GGDEF domain-containing protein n=1 Tax=Deinococcus peraridilitoris TaxID=432329 RepID=UPI0012F9A7B9|nr:GGDEF domain-containing protein [Deinococcus peraridilitoris]
MSAALPTSTLSLDPAAPIRRAALTTMLLLSVLTAVLTLAFAVTASWSHQDTVGLALLGVWDLGLLLALRLWPGSLRTVGYLFFVVGAVVGVMKFAWSVLAPGQVPYFGPYAYWLPLSYLVAVVVLPPRAALLSSLAVYAAFLAVGGVFAFYSDLPVAVTKGAISGFLQFYLSHAVYLSVYAMLAYLCRQYLRAVIQAEQQAQTAFEDVLTGLPNRRQLNLWLEADLARAQVYGEPFSLVVFDLDHFKQINDSFGHETGDVVLRTTASTVKRALRDDSRFGRWGGEEFVLLLPKTDLEGARRVAQRLDQLLRSESHPRAGVVSASFGVAQATVDDTPSSLFARADAAMYSAKQAGRARVHV